jgi:hypothetical protein
MKPYYFDSYTCIVFESVHEDTDFVVIIKDIHEFTKYFRIHATTPYDAANNAYFRYITMKEEYEKINADH